MHEAAASGTRILLVSPRGFCAGVARAIRAADAVLARHPAPVYGLHELVHNDQVVKGLAARGMRFVETLDAVPPGAVVLFSAHGVTPAVRAAAAARGLRVVDATCPFVERVHREVRRSVAAGRRVLFIGKAGHQEVVGVVGEAPGQVQVIATPAEAAAVAVADPERVTLLTQTTLSTDDCAAVTAVLRRRFPAIQGQKQGDICYATRNRQRAVRAVAEQSDVVLVFGAHNSSNTNRLVEVARAAGPAAHLVADAAELAAVDLAGARRIGVTAGASTPEDFVSAMVAQLARTTGGTVEYLEVMQEQVDLPDPPLDG